MKKIANRNWFLKVGALFLTLVVISTMLATTAFADEKSVITEVRLIQLAVQATGKPTFYVRTDPGYIVTHEESYVDDSSGATVYWWKYTLEAGPGMMFDTENETPVYGGSATYTYLEVLDMYNAILTVSSRRIEVDSTGRLSNPSVYGITPEGTSITGIIGTAPTAEEAFQNNGYSFFWENGFYFCSDSAGQKQTGKVLCNRGYGNKWYYFAPAEADYTICNLQGELITMHFPEGAMLYGTWLKEGNYYYYFQADGSMAVSQYIYWNGQSYYMNEMGVYTTW